jgi:acyl-coenzyme A thioesterase PaaI-like protein
MSPKRSAPVHPDDQAIRARVLRSIVANRIPGLHFPSHFLGVEWRKIAGGTVRAGLTGGPHCRDANGAINLTALGLFTDNILATAVRTGAEPGARLATIHLQAQFTGAPATGNLDAESHLLGRSEGSTLQRSLSSATICANGRPVCHANGEFVLLDPPPGVVLAPLPWERTEKPPPVASIDTDNLEPHERTILRACDAALAKASPQAPFIQHFWGGVPRRTAQGASNRLTTGPHIGNRVGHAQGGILLGLAATAACTAAPAAMMLANISVWYTSPGRDTELKIRSRLIHTGRTMAVVRTEIKDAAGERIVEAISHHVARKHA